MKKKIGTAIDETIFRRLRVHAAQKGRNVGDVIEESISSYLALHEGSADERMAAFERFTSRPFSLSRQQLDVILEEDSLEQQ
jgi:plasmid stability protein